MCTRVSRIVSLLVGCLVASFLLSGATALAAPIPLTSGMTVSGIVSVAGSTNAYTFDTSAGDLVLLNVRARSGDIRPYATVRTPSDALFEGGYPSPHFSFTATETGTYSLAIGDLWAQDTGEYEFTILTVPGASSVPGDTNGGPIASAETVLGTVNAQTDMDAYTFSGTAGQRVIAPVAAFPGPLNPQLILVSPTGTQSPADTGGTINAVLESSGTYIARVEALSTSSPAMTA